jgi:nicotinamide-nucleotide amidase
VTPAADIATLAARVLDEARSRGLRIATAESCTGGLVSAALTDIAGSSDVFERGFITYSNEAKQDLLGVPADTIRAHGAVSREAAAALAEGALAKARADISVSITGIAGPGGGSALKPVGLVHFATASRSHGITSRQMNFGNLGRAGIRTAATRVALEMLLDAIRR